MELSEKTIEVLLEKSGVKQITERDVVEGIELNSGFVPTYKCSTCEYYGDSKYCTKNCD